MGEIYLARDTRLGREVALKVLPAEFSADPGRRTRLEREARFVSRLNHPRICQIYDIGRDGGTDYLVMEYLRGQTLAARIAEGALPMRELLQVALEVAEGLEAAHRAGLVHRDLKPANIVLTSSGAKLLDFGIARAAAAPASEDAVTEAIASAYGESDLTLTGVVIGSIPYLSPEQIEGREADSRSDVFSFGATLFEMATGRRAFEGADRTERLRAILQRAVPPVSSLRPRTLPALDALVARCLEKAPADRWPDGGAARGELVKLSEQVRARTLEPGRRRRTVVRGIVAVATLAVAATVVAWLVNRRRTETPIHALIGAPEHVRFLLSGDEAGPPALSPDGRTLAFVAVDEEGRQDIWLRPLAEQNARILPGTENARFPFWSPDGGTVAFFSADHLVRVDLASERRTEVCTAWSGRGGSWGSRGNIVFAGMYRSGISVVPATGGTPREIVARWDTLAYTTFRWPHFLPDGKRFVFFAGRHTGEAFPPGGEAALPSVRGGVFVASTDDPRPRLLRATEGEALVAGGHLLFGSHGLLMAQRFEPGAARLVGLPFPTGERVFSDTSTWKLNATVSVSGTIAFDATGPSTGYEVLWLDRAGGITGRTGTRADHVNVRLSPDERQLAVETREGNVSRLWLWDLARNSGRRLESEADCVMPCWTPDGRSLLYARLLPRKLPTSSQALEPFWHPLGGDSAGRFLKVVRDNTWPEDMTPDGRTLLCANGGFVVDRAGRWVKYGFRRGPPSAPLDAPGAPPTIASPFRVDRARISPDGGWLAYTVRVSGHDEVRVTPFDAARFPKELGNASRGVSPLAGTSRPRWRADGRELFFLRGLSKLSVVSVTRHGDSLAIGPERMLFRLPQRDSRNSYDVSRDGQRFVVVSQGHEDEARITVVSDWQRKLEGGR